jgi:hypothetical protein
MRRRLGVFALFFLFWWVPLSSAEEWGGITPGVSTLESVAARYGNPSRETRQKLEGYDTVQWVYEGGKAPPGMTRMTVDFGLLTPKGYEPKPVRSFLLEPRPGVFARQHVLEGWGLPNRAGVQNDRTVFVYQSGLVVFFDQEEVSAVSMLFTIPQPETPPPPK